MNKTFAKITYYSCFVIALCIAYVAYNYAGSLAYSGAQPLVWLNILAFFAAVSFVVLAIILKAKYKL